jgi:SNF2 family DNA or RNA helicase
MVNAMKEKKSTSKKRIQKISNTKKPDAITFEDWQTTLRKQFSSEQKFSVKNIGDHKVYSDFEVRNPLTKKIYKVAIRSQTNGLNFCSCPDFKVNNLGTCKHIEYVFNLLRSKKTLTKILNKGYERPYSSVTLKYGTERKVVLRIGSSKREEIKKLAETFFDSNFVLQESGFEKFEKFLEKVLKYDPQFRCYQDALEYILIEREKQNRKRSIAKKFTNGLQSKELNKVIKATLYPYQKEAVLKALEAGRYIIADDMGLGKTIQSLAIAESLKNIMGIESVLIVCPTSLKYQWETELKKFTESSSTVVEGLVNKRQQHYASNSFYKIISYQVATRDTDIINRMNPDLIILDEAQRIKNWKTKTAQSIKQLESPYCLVLTGTPLENKLDELHSLVEFVDRYKMGTIFIRSSNYRRGW